MVAAPRGIPNKERLFDFISRAMPPAELGRAWLTLRYQLTVHRQFDILQSGLGRWGPNAIRSVETLRVHHAYRRRGGRAATCPTKPAAGSRVLCMPRWCPSASEESNDRSDDLRPGPRRLPGARPGADPHLRAERPEPRHGRALRHWQRPVPRLARPHHVHDDDDERCDAVLRFRRPPHGHGHWIASPLMARSSPPFPPSRSPCAILLVGGTLRAG